MEAVKKKREKMSKTQEEGKLVETVINVRRVVKVIKGGRRFAFSALVVVGDTAGKVGVALGKSRDATSAIAKALKRARKDMFVVPLYKTTVPFTITGRHGASKVLIRSASRGTGVIAGGAVRAVMEALGVKDVLAKSIGSGNPQNAVKATIDALKKMRSASYIMNLRGKSLKEIFGDKNVNVA